MPAQNNASGNVNRRANRFIKAPLLAVVHFQTDAAFGLAGEIPTGIYLPKGAVILRADIVPVGLVGAINPAISMGHRYVSGASDNNSILQDISLLAFLTANHPDAGMGALTGLPLEEIAELTFEDGSTTQATDGTIDIYLWHTYG